MLSQLSIRDIVLIEQLDIEFDQGLSVLTGETGAGKSILLDALSLALGARGDGGLVRAGAQSGQVTAVFDLANGHGVAEILRENSIEFVGQVILKRIQSGDGRSKAFVNDQAVSVGLMREIGRRLVELHGQHDERALLEPAVHRSLVDAYGALEAQLHQVQTKWAQWQQAVSACNAHKKRVAEVAREADYLKDSVGELLALAPQPGEETALAERRARMMKVEKIAIDINDAMETLSGAASALPTLANLARKLHRKMAEVPGLLDEAVSELDSGIDALYRAQQAIEVAARETAFEPAELERFEERLFALRAAARKYSVAVENLPDLAVRLADDLENLHAGEEKLAEMERALSKHKADYFKLAAMLSKGRRNTASQIVTAVMKELPALKLGQAEFIVNHQADEASPGPDGFDQIEFWVRTNPGSKAGPLVKIASGGELSRFMLALKVVLADKGSAPTLVFDEIDTGIGGAVADAIGRRLDLLSKNVQVLSVTHAPQVAAKAGRHYVIVKAEILEDQAGRVATGIEEVFGEQRREEIARMLSGASITDEARAAAQQLIGELNPQG